MPYYRRVGDVPRKRHTLHRDDGRAGPTRGADGGRGLLVGLFADVPPAIAERDRGGRVGPRRRTGRPTERAAPAAPPPHASVAGGATISCRAGICCWRTRTSPCRSHRPPARAACIETPPATSWCTSSQAPACSSRCSDASRSAPATTSSSRCRQPIVGSCAGTEPLRALIFATVRSCPASGEASDQSGSVPRGRAVLGAGPARSGRPHRRRRRRRRRARASPRRHDPLHVRPPPVRRGRLGRLPLPVGPVDPRLRTDRRRIHQPPPVHQTFAGPNFVVCSFVPRLFDFDPNAVKIPYHHANVDSDEVLFYSAGNFMSRAGSGIGEGSISLHPGRLRARPPAGQPGAEHGQGSHRGAGRDARHVPAARTDRRRPVHLRPGLSLVMGRPLELTVSATYSSSTARADLRGV